MTKLERLQKAVVDTKDARNAAYDAYAAAWVAADDAWDDVYTADDAWSKAKRELNEYLKEQDK